MDNLLPENEYTEVEGRAYINPQTGIDETNTFIENLRATQGQQNQEIAEQTYNLGTAVPSVQGGLGAPTDAGLAYFTSRYQTPMTNTTVANLRATAQAKALNDVLANEQAIWKERYNQAYRNYQKRARARARARANAPTTQNPNTTNDSEPDVEKNIITPQKSFGVPDTIMSETDTHYIYTDPKTGEQTKVSKDYMKQIYDENGNITDDGMVILDTRRMLGL